MSGWRIGSWVREQFARGFQRRILPHQQHQRQLEQRTGLDAGRGAVGEFGDGEVDFLALQERFGQRLMGFLQAQAHDGYAVLVELTLSSSGTWSRNACALAARRNRWPASPRSSAATSSRFSKNGVMNSASRRPAGVNAKGRRWNNRVLQKFLPARAPAR